MGLLELHAGYSSEIMRKVREQFPDADLHIDVGTVDVEISQIAQMLKEHYTAVCTSSMLGAQSIYLYCAENGVRIPEDLSYFYWQFTGRRKGSPAKTNVHVHLYAANGEKRGLYDGGSD